MKARYKISAKLLPLIAFKCYRGFLLLCRHWIQPGCPLGILIPSIWIYIVPKISKDLLEKTENQLTVFYGYTCQGHP
jgi:hypothetical protein